MSLKKVCLVFKDPFPHKQGHPCWTEYQTIQVKVEKINRMLDQQQKTQDYKYPHSKGVWEIEVDQ
jgi:hypothetical protein